MMLSKRDRLFKFIGRSIHHDYLPNKAGNALTRKLFFLSDKVASEQPREVFHGETRYDADMFANLSHPAVKPLRKELVSSWESPEILFDYCVAARAKTIVELGTRGCNSTQALVRAASLTGGHVYSYDPLPYTGSIAPAYRKHWTFHQCTGEEGYQGWDPAKKIDLLFIDTDPHGYEQTVMWLHEHWINALRPGAMILLDDAAAWLEGYGVHRACREFVEANRERIRFAVLEAARPPAAGLFVIELAP